MHADSAVSLRALGNAIALTTHAGSVPSAAIAMEVATGGLYIEALYDELDFDLLGQRGGALAQRLQRACAGGEPDALDPWMEDLYRRVGERQTMGTVVSELRATWPRSRWCSTSFSGVRQTPNRLRDVPGRLAQMRGVFSVLGLHQPALGALRMRNLVEQSSSARVLPTHRSASRYSKARQQRRSHGFSIDMLSYQRSLARHFSSTTRQGAVSLHHGPLAQSRAGWALFGQAFGKHRRRPTSRPFLGRRSRTVI